MNSQTFERVALIFVLSVAVSGPAVGSQDGQFEREAAERMETLRAVQSNPSVATQGQSNENRLRPVTIKAPSTAGHHGHH